MLRLWPSESRQSFAASSPLVRGLMPFNRPYMLSRIDWNNPRNDPIFRQFLPLKSVMLPDHPKLVLDPLHETADSPEPGLVHRYPDKVLFLGKPL